MYIASNDNQNKGANQSFCNIAGDLITLKFIWPTLPHNGGFGISHNALRSDMSVSIHVNIGKIKKVTIDTKRVFCIQLPSFIIDLWICLYFNEIWILWYVVLGLEGVKVYTRWRKHLGAIARKSHLPWTCAEPSMFKHK